MIRRILLIAWDTFRDVARHKMLSVHLVFMVIALGLFNLFGHFSTTPQLEYRMVQDVGISVISLFGLLITLFIGASTLREDLSRRTAYAILTLPLSRKEFYLGKFLGTLLATVVNVFIMVAIFAGLLYLKFGTIWYTFFWVVLFMTMEFAIVTSLVLLFSLSDSTLLCFSFTLFFVILGNLVEYVSHLVMETGISLLETCTQVFFWIAPNFGYFNIKARILKDFVIPPDLIFWASGYSLAYLLCAVALGMLFMERRDL